jgi:hypothetical protein
LQGDVIAKFYDNASWIFLHQGTRSVLMRDNMEWTPQPESGGFPEYWNIKVTKKA